VLGRPTSLLLCTLEGKAEGFLMDSMDKSISEVRPVDMLFRGPFHFTKFF
jgi:hypothetical protein